MPPIVLFGLQFTFCLVAYGLLARWYVVPRIAGLTAAGALAPLLWVHVFRMVGGSILAPGSVDAAVPDAFRFTVGIGDMATAILALICIGALRRGGGGAVRFVWVFLVVATLDTGSAVVQSIADQVFAEPLGLNWVIVTAYVPALLVTSVLMLAVLLRPAVGAAVPVNAGAGAPGGAARAR